MKRILTLMLVLVAAAALMAGCSSDKTTAPAANNDTAKDFVRGEIESGATAFEYTADTEDGMLRIRGSNLSYDDAEEILAADIELINETGMDLEGPVRLLFLQVLPDGVMILNADEPDSAVSTGALFHFAFADTDTVWLDGAATAARTVQFGVEPGVSIGFTSRILVGEEPAGGTIGGLVWHDRNEDGVADEDEMGVPEVEVMLYHGEKSDHESMMMYAMTDQDGYYHFSGLGAGHYTVGLGENEYLMPTTEPQMEVILVEYADQVGDFLMADFGVVRTMETDPLACLQEGACINAKGWALDDSTGGLMAERLNVCDREEDCDDEGHDEGEEDDKDGYGNDCWGRLAGPITAIDREARALAVMGTWVYLPGMDWDKHDDDGDLEMGLRVRVKARLVETEEGPMVEACRLHFWNGHGDRVRGHVQEIVSDEEGNVTGVMVLNTFVALPEGFECDMDDDYDDDDDEEDDS